MSEPGPSAAVTAPSPKGKSPSKSPTPPPAAVLGVEAGPTGVDPSYADDGDSAVGDDDESRFSDTTSIAPSILEYRQLHGRTYHNFQGAEYWGPNDERQNEGLDLFHYMMFIALSNKLYLAPIEDPQNVLDVGTGTGIWAMDFADEFPSAEVIGTDLSPIQPGWVPPNCKFEIDNCENPWTFPDNSFDYIHVRGLVGCIQDWPKFYQECMRALKPGGWLEQQEFALPYQSYDGTLPEDSVWHQWGQIFIEAGEKMGRTFEITKFWDKWLKDAGFTGELHKHEVPIPVGGWPRDKQWKEVGLVNKLSLEQGLDGFAMYLCTMTLGWKEEEVQVLLAKVRAALKGKGVHAFYPMRTVWTQKPTSA